MLDFFFVEKDIRFRDLLEDCVTSCKNF